jgi:putative transposase
LELVQASHQASGGIYGSPRVFEDVRETRKTCGRNRVARIMKQHKIKGVYGYKKPRYSGGRPNAVAPNRLKPDFFQSKPNTGWVTDISVLHKQLRR